MRKPYHGLRTEMIDLSDSPSLSTISNCWGIVAYTVNGQDQCGETITTSDDYGNYAVSWQAPPPFDD